MNLLADFKNPHCRNCSINFIVAALYPVYMVPLWSSIVNIVHNLLKFFNNGGDH